MKKFKAKHFIPAFLAIGLIVMVFSSYESNDEELVVHNPTDINLELVDASLHQISKNHKVLDFELLNQNGEVITHENYKNKIYVVDFFFTSCPTICPLMTNNMAKIQKEFLEDDDIMLLSLSVTPEFDSIPKLKEYANKNGVIDSKWNVTTGDKTHIYDLARKSYFATTDTGDGGLQDFIHTSNFVLVDKKRQIRGVYNGIDNDEILRLIEDIKVLTN
ncbi:SCO family protein [Kriegella aquimaris]|uniref:Protein SCO1/2 n=1 Tax=Kriegella aquimaris TaxID=192904 RepID=A0A1G9SAK6_9FLAO|nr:SCO family protein [Kriegella aquimaris]SDM31815.1 protein SCO1/2 [Kriegella aquimaris]